MKLLFAALLLLSACSSQPLFRKVEGAGGSGYRVVASDLKEVFDVAVDFEGSVHPTYKDDYLTRAAGEECAQRGYKYFDFGALSARSWRVICYAENAKRGLGVAFDQKAALGPKAVLRVSETVIGSYAPVQPWDIVRKVAGQSPRTIGEFKDVIYREARAGKNTVTMLVERSEIPLKVEASLNEKSGDLAGPEMLEEAKRRVP